MDQEQRTPLLSAAGAEASSTDWRTREPDCLEAPRSPFDPEFEPEDYTTMLYNLHSWSYRVSCKDFQYYQQRRVHQLKQQLGFEHICRHHISQRHMESFRRQLSRTGSRPYGDAKHQPLAPKQSEHATGHSLNPPSSIRVPSSSWPLKPSRRTLSWMGLPMLPVTHKLMLAWAILMLVTDLVYTALLLPLFVAFDLNSYGHTWFWVPIVVGWLFVGDFLVILHRGVVIRYLDQHMYVDLPLDVARLYMAHGSFWTDFIVATSTPLQMLLSLLLPHLPDGSPPQLHRGSLLLLLLKLLPLLRGLRLLRLLLLQRELFLGKVGLRHIRRKLIWFLFSLAYVLLVLLNWLACIMIFIAHNNLEPQDSWLASVKGLDLTASSHPRQYIAALYWMMVTTTTVGYGDVSPGTELEQVAVLGAVLCGVSFIAYSINALMDVLLETALQDENAQRVALLRERANTLRIWATWQDLPEQLMERISSYSAGPWLTHTVIQRSWSAALGDLPPDIKGELLWVMLVERHQGLAPLGRRLLRGLPHACALALLALLDFQPLAPGQMLAWAGDPATHVWLLQEGEVVEMAGVLPTGPAVEQSQLIAAHDMEGWVEQQMEAGTATRVKGAATKGGSRVAHRHTRGHHASISISSRRRRGRAGHSSSSSSSEVGTAAGPDGGSGEEMQGQAQGQQRQGGKGTQEPQQEQQEDVGRQADDRMQHAVAEEQQQQPQRSQRQARRHRKHNEEGDIKLELAASWRYSKSLQASTICFLWGLPLNRLALALRCMPGLGDNLMAEIQRQLQEEGGGQE